MHGHYLVLFHNFEPAQRQQLVGYIQTSSLDWANYSADAFLLCTTVPRQTLLERMQAIAPTTRESFLLLDMTLAQAVGGKLPEAAWRWLRKHGFMHNIG